jgi:hypothetical protein
VCKREKEREKQREREREREKGRVMEGETGQAYPSWRP